MLQTPTRFTMVAASSEGQTALNAFDGALLGAGCGNMNLIRVSSILPPGAEQAMSLAIAPGSLLPTAYGHISSTTPGEQIAAAVGIGFGEPGAFGLIMETAFLGSAQEAEARIRKMLEEGFRVRQLTLSRVLVKSAEHHVVSCGCAFAAVCLWG
ncbi:MAG: pyruvoyl-dependent arginine decarboxylase [Sulfobacillus sp.]